MTKRDHLELPGDVADELQGPQRGATPIDWVVFALRAARRRSVLAAAVLIAGIGASAAYYALKSPSYRVEAKILAQRPQALPSVVRSAYEDVPTRSAWEMIHRRDNLIALVEETNLLQRVAAAPPRKPSVIERIQRLASRSGPRSGEAPLDALVTLLDKVLVVTVEEGTIIIKLDWGDPRQAYEIVQAALQNFLELRHLQDVTAIDEVISVLQGRAAKLRAELDGASEDARRRPPQAARPVAPRVKLPSEELVRLQSLLEAKRRAIQDVEEFRRRRLADLQAQLDQARNTLSDAHPTVIGLRKDIEVASRESPQIEALREDERKVRREYSERMAREGFPATTAVPVTVAPASDANAPREEDARVRELRLQYEQMTTRINQAQLELDAARAGFKYRYNVIWPPQLPTEPVTPKAGKIFVLGGLASLVLALLAAAAPDVLRGRIVERWQVERSLDLPVLGEIRRRP